MGKQLVNQDVPSRVCRAAAENEARGKKERAFGGVEQSEIGEEKGEAESVMEWRERQQGKVFVEKYPGEPREG